MRKRAYVVVGGVALAATVVARFAACSPPSTNGPPLVDGGVLVHVHGSDALPDPPIVPDDSDAWDAGVNPFTGDWTHLPGDPINCGLRIAVNPASSVGPLSFVPCESGRPGCRRLVVDWTDNPYGAIFFPDFDTEPVKQIGDKRYLLMERRWPLDPQFQYTGATAAIVAVVDEVDGPPVFAVGTFTPPPPFRWCGFMPAFSSAGVAVHALPRPYQSWDIFAWGGWPPSSSLTSKTFPHAVFPGGCDFCGRVTISGAPSLLSCQCEGQDIPALFNTGNQALTFVGAAPFVGRDIFSAVKDGWIAQSNLDPAGIDLIRRDGSTVPLVRHPHRVLAMAVDRTDGDRLAWMEADEVTFGVYGPATLWTAPYAATPASLVARRVAVSPEDDVDPLWIPGHEMVVNVGCALFRASRKVAYLTRLTDGLSWSIPAEPGQVFTRPLWVDSGEVWLATADEKTPTKPFGIVRLARSNLGTPTVGPGL